MIFGFLDKIRIDIKKIHNKKKVYDNKMSTNPGKRRDQQIFDEKSLEKSMQNERKKKSKKHREKKRNFNKKIVDFSKEFVSILEKYFPIFSIFF